MLEKSNIKKSNLLLLLEDFNKYELNKIRKFITSPYFNKSEKIIDLFDFLIDDLTRSEFQNKENYFKKIYGDETYDDQKFRNLNSDLFQLILKFLAQEMYENDNQNQANNLLQSIKERGIKSLYKKTISTAKKWMDRNKLRDSDYYLQSYKIENNIFKLTSDYEKKTKLKKNFGEIDILKVNDNLDYFYMTEKLRYYNSYLSWKTMTKIDYEFPYIDKVLAIVKTYKQVLPAALQIYYEVYKISVNSEDVESYYRLKELIQVNLHLFDAYESSMIYSFSLNFAIKQINKGKVDFYEELLELYTYAVDNELIFDNGYLSPTSFRNIVTLALRLKKNEWAKNFIDNKIHLLPEKYRENAYKYNLSRIYFYKKEYKEVVHTIREVEFDDPLYANMSKSMLMVSFYELYDEEALVYFSESFRAYMRRSKGISEKVRKEYLNLIKYIMKLNKSRYNPAILPKLKEEIIATKELASKQWFIEKLENVKLPNDQ